MPTLWLDGVGHAGFLMRPAALDAIAAAIASVCADGHDAAGQTTSLAAAAAPTGSSSGAAIGADMHDDRSGAGSLLLVSEGTRRRVRRSSALGARLSATVTG